MASNHVPRAADAWSGRALHSQVRQLNIMLNDRFDKFNNGRVFCRSGYISIGYVGVRTIYPMPKYPMPLYPMYFDIFVQLSGYKLAVAIFRMF